MSTIPKALIVASLLFIHLLHSKFAFASDQGKSTAYIVSAEQMRDIGIAVRIANPKAYLASIEAKVSPSMINKAGFGENSPPFPNRCFIWSTYGGGVELTLSDELLESYKKRGFVLDSVCLGMYSFWVRFDPDNGRPLRSVRPSLKIGGKNHTVAYILLDIPNCFSKGTPLKDCSHAYDELRGTRETNDHVKFRRAQAAGFEKIMNALIRKGYYSKVCTCGDFLEDKDVNGRPAIANCRPDPAPQCEKKWRGGLDPGGWVHPVPYLPSDVAQKLVGFESEYFWLLGMFKIIVSPRLPRGYGNTWYIPGGEDDTPLLTLAPGDRIGAGR